MASTTRPLAAAISFLVLAPSAQAEERFRLLFNGSFATQSLDYASTRNFTEFAEAGSNTGRFSVDSGIGIDVGLQVNVLKHVGVMASYTRYKQDAGGSFEASLPHPLYFGQPRQASGELPGNSYEESAGHLDVVVSGDTGRLNLSAWGGLSLFTVKGSLLSSVAYTHTYPYDSITISSTPTSAAKDKPKGWNVGAGVDVRLFKHVALGAQVRYSQAKARLSVGELSTEEFDAGGLQAGGGVRIVF